MQARRTSRKPVQAGKWTPRARSAQRAHASLKGNTATRRGRLRHKGVSAQQYKGSDPVLKGRIILDRGAGVVEFPNADQFDRIAREEGVPAELVDKAFGHIPRARKTTRKRSRKPRKTSRGGMFRGLFGLAKNAAKGRRKRVRRDDVFVPHTVSGEDLPLRAQTVLIPQAQVGSFGAQRGIYMDAANQTIILPFEQAFQVMDRWLSKKEFDKAFGHLRTVGVLGATERRRPIPSHFGPRSMRLGHRMPPGEGAPRPGIVKGQLILWHKPTGSILWQAYDDEVNYPDKPIWIWFGAHKAHFDFPKAMMGAKVGSGERAAVVGAVDRGIPEMAMLQAFDHLLQPDQRRAAYELFASK